ncbi:MAG: TldD/PmbA family protein [Bacilli bacterium]
MLSKKLALDTINLSLKTGADFAELFYEDTTKQFIQLDNGKVEDLVEGQIFGVGIRLLKGLRSVYGYTNNVTKKGLFELANKLSKSFDDKQIVKDIDKFEVTHYKRVNKKVLSYNEVNKKDIIDLLKKSTAVMANYDKRIVRTVGGFLITMTDVNIFNSKGKFTKDHREWGRFILQSIASENRKIETRFDGPGNQKGWEWFKEDNRMLKVAQHNAEKVILMLGAKECPSGNFPVVIGNGWGGVIFHEACGHQLEATSVAKKLSVFTDMVGKAIASPVVSAYDNGVLANEWGSSNVDDEGIPAQNNLLIKDGILQDYLVDSFNGRRMNNHPGNGCCRRESYKYEPTSRMSNTYIAKGKSKPEDIIKATKLGIYAVSFNGGSVNPATGEFNFGCSEAYLIKDGKIDQPLRGATLIGKATEILKNIDMVGNDVDLGQGMCGSSSGSIPVNVGQPTIRIKTIIVGGRGGSINEL